MRLYYDMAGYSQVLSLNLLCDETSSFKSLNGDEDPIHIINVCIKSGSSTMEKQEEEKEQFQSIINKRVSSMKKIISHFGTRDAKSHRRLLGFMIVARTCTVEAQSTAEALSASPRAAGSAVSLLNGTQRYFTGLHH